MKYNKELQQINNEQKAYLLGLFYSDGYVCSTNNNCGITLHSNDLILLNKLIENFPFFKLRKSHENAYKIDCTSKQLKIDLLNNGVLNLKSSENREKFKFPTIHKSLYSHFIRGYFDGDGSVYKQKLFNIKIEIGGTSYKLITDIIKILFDNKISVNLAVSYKGIGLRKLDYFKLYTSSYRESKVFAEYIYKDSTIFLERKYNILNIIPEYSRTERLICSLCNSSNTIYNGFRNNKVRIKCKDCNKMSTQTTALNSSNIINGRDELLEA